MKTVTALLVLSYAACAHAADAVPPTYVMAARAHAVPPPVLYAVALAESGAPMVSGAFLPWPWTLNVAGAPRYYRTRQAAYRDLVDTLNRGIRNVDIGIAQINWRWNGQRFPDPWRALDPAINLLIGAAILQEAYAGSGDWLDAAGRYHAPNHPSRARRYAARVARHLRRLGAIE